jgi:hypothetical protein
MVARRVDITDMASTGSSPTASNANTIQALLAPRVMRFGIKFNW